MSDSIQFLCPAVLNFRKSSQEVLAPFTIHPVKAGSHEFHPAEKQHLNYQNSITPPHSPCRTQISNSEPSSPL